MPWKWSDRFQRLISVTKVECVSSFKASHHVFTPTVEVHPMFGYPMLLRCGPCFDWVHTTGTMQPFGIVMCILGTACRLLPVGMWCTDQCDNVPIHGEYSCVHVTPRIEPGVLGGLVQVLVECHERGVVHGNVKPANIMSSLDKHGVTLMGFGASSIKDGALRPHDSPPPPKNTHIHRCFSDTLIHACTPAYT
jgi:hypothetical protein